MKAHLGPVLQSLSLSHTAQLCAHALQIKCFSASRGLSVLYPTTQEAGGHPGLLEVGQWDGISRHMVNPCPP